MCRTHEEQVEAGIHLSAQAEETLIKMWAQDISLEYHTTLIRSIPRNLKEVFCCKGLMIKYY
jgi:hypothetical protein